MPPSAPTQRSVRRTLVDNNIVRALMVPLMLHNGGRPLPAVANTRVHCVQALHNLLAEPTLRHLVLGEGYIWALQKLVAAEVRSCVQVAVLCVWHQG